MVNSTSALLSWPEAKDSTYSCKYILEADMSIIINDPTIEVLVIKAFFKIKPSVDRNLGRNAKKKICERGLWIIL